MYYSVKTEYMFGIKQKTSNFSASHSNAAYTAPRNDYFETTKTDIVIHYLFL